MKKSIFILKFAAAAVISFVAALTGLNFSLKLSQGFDDPDLIQAYLGFGGLLALFLSVFFGIAAIWVWLLKKTES